MPISIKITFKKHHFYSKNRPSQVVKLLKKRYNPTDCYECEDKKTVILWHYDYSEKQIENIKILLKGMSMWKIIESIKLTIS